ncbi:MAG: ATP-binding protein [Sporomusa sp.]
MACDQENAVVGQLKEMDCPDCLNRGYVTRVVEGKPFNALYKVQQECACMKQRRSIRMIEKSGLKDLMQRYTFENFKVTHAYQEQLLNGAKRFLECTDGQWFYMGGQPGVGKTHICTAMTGEMIKAGKSARYMLWLADAGRLKANIMDDVQYERMIGEFKHVDVLYIDDLFKTEANKAPTAADIKLAFDIINYRYNNSGLVTIISTEHYIDELIDFDEAVGSRVYERTKEFCFKAPRDMKKNYRLCGG